MDIKGKGAFAALEVEIYNALFFGDIITSGLTTIPITNGVDGEHGSTPDSPGPYTIQVTNHTTFKTDLGVRYTATGGYLQQVTAGSEAAGKYSVAPTGTYTFAIADKKTDVLIAYTYTVAGTGAPGALNQRTLTGINHIQGYGPIFELWLMQPYQGTNGLHLFQCRASKMSAPHKRDNYVISDFEFESYPNAAGQWFEWFQITN